MDDKESMQEKAFHTLWDQLQMCREPAEAMARDMLKMPDATMFAALVSSLQELVFLRAQLAQLADVYRSLDSDHAGVAAYVTYVFEQAILAGSKVVRMPTAAGGGNVGGREGREQEKPDNKENEDG